MGVDGHRIHGWPMRYWCSFLIWPLRHSVSAVFGAVCPISLQGRVLHGHNAWIEGGARSRVGR